MRKYVLIPDSFKGTMSSLDVCRIVTDAILSQEPDAAVCAIPVADGGEGTVDAFLSAVGGQRIPVNCTGPYGEPITACYGLLPDGTAVVEMAAAAGRSCWPWAAAPPMTVAAARPPPWVSAF